MGWGEGGSPALWCRARVVLPAVEKVLTCCSWAGLKDPGGWRPARLSLALAGGAERSETVLRCSAEGSTAGGRQRPALQLQVPLVFIAGLRRLTIAGSEAPGLEVHFEGRRPRLQLLADLGGCGPDAATAGARLQLLHAFLAATAEVLNVALEPEPRRRFGWRRGPRLCVEPLEWPHAAGRRASLKHLAAVLRGVIVVTTAEVQETARFGGSHCPVCLEQWDELPPDRSAVVLACGHAFCEACLGPAVERLRAACPSCRVELGPRREPSGRAP